MIPFQIPAQFISQFASGDIVRYGAILKDAASGQIIGHVQETGLLQKALSSAVSFDPTGVSSLVGVGQNIQMTQQLSAIQTALSGMQSLQLATLISSVAGIGVTAASTALIMKRLNRIDGSLNTLEQGILRLPQQLQGKELRRVIIDVTTAIERMSEISIRKDAQRIAKNAEEALHIGFNRLIDGVKIIIAEETVNEPLLRSVLAGVALCGAAEIKTLIWLNEMDVAEARAKTQSAKLEEIAIKMPADILGQTIQGGRDTAVLISKEFLEIRMRVASQPSLIQHLISIDVSGQEYAEQIDAEDENPLLFLALHEGNK